MTNNIDPTIQQYYADMGYKLTDSIDGVPYNVPFVNLEESSGKQYIRCNSIGINKLDGDIITEWRPNPKSKKLAYKFKDAVEAKRARAAPVYRSSRFGDLIADSYTGTVRFGWDKRLVLDMGVIVSVEAKSKKRVRKSQKSNIPKHNDTVSILVSEYDDHVWNMSGESSDPQCPGTELSLLLTNSELEPDDVVNIAHEADICENLFTTYDKVMSAHDDCDHIVCNHSSADPCRKVAEKDVRGVIGRIVIKETARASLVVAYWYVNHYKPINRRLPVTRFKEWIGGGISFVPSKFEKRLAQEEGQENNTDGFDSENNYVIMSAYSELNTENMGLSLSY